MARAEAMSDVSVLLAALALLLTTVAVWWAIGHRAPQRWKARARNQHKHPRVQVRGPRRSPGAPVAPRASRPHTTLGKRRDARASSRSVPCSCDPLVRVAKELQMLMLLLWARNGKSTPLYSGMWWALWAQLKQLGKRGHLPLCASSCCSRRRRPSKRLLPPGLAILGKASRPSRKFCERSIIPPRSSGRQRCSIRGTSTASDGLQPCKTLPAVDHLPPSENLPITETPRPSTQLPTASVSAESPQPFKILHLPRPVPCSTFQPPSQTVTPGSLDPDPDPNPSQPMRKSFQLVDSEEPLDSSSCSLRDQQHPTDVDSTGTSQSIATDGENREAEIGPQLEPLKHSQEQAVEPPVSSSGSQDAVPEPAEDSPSSVAHTVPRRPRRFTNLQEARPRRK